MIIIGSQKNWTDEEKEYLCEKWGVISASGIAKHLKRTFSGVFQKAQRMGLGDPTTHFDGITICQLMNALDKTYSVSKVWIRDYGMPVKTKLFAKEKRVRVITYPEFWKWAEQHKELMNFAKMDPNTLGTEPEWMKIKRRADNLRSQKTWQSVAWTAKEDQQLAQMLQTSNMTYPKLASHFNRSESSIRRRIYDLNIKFSPKRLNNHIKYTAIEIEKLSIMACQGYGYETIAQELGKSALGVRGKLERMKFDFKKTPVFI